jgi:hypothetical protein
MDTSILNLFEKYKELLAKKPLETKAVSSCVIGIIGEGVGTYIKNRKSGDTEELKAIAKR